MQEGGLEPDQAAAATHKDWAMALANYIITESPSPDAIRQAGMVAKRAITDAYVALWRSMQLVDDLIAVNAPDPSWQFGWYQYAPTTQTTQSAGVPPTKRVDRAQEVLTMAARLLNEGAQAVTSSEIAKRLIADGVIRDVPERNLATAAGNILARTPGWSRVRAGEYMPVERETAIE